MQPMTAAAFEDLYTRLIDDDNRSVYEQKNGVPPYHKMPHCLYFYYIRFLSDGGIDVRHYFHDNGAAAIAPGDLTSLIRRLALNARLDEDVPPKTGRRWEDIRWRRKSYLVIVMDSQRWAFQPGKALVFNPEKSSVPNQSFFDGRDIQVDMSPGGNGSEIVTGLLCKNHMKKNRDGEDIGRDGNGNPETQRFVFTLSFLVDGFPDPHTIDPGGENTGPVVPPPAEG